MEPLALMTPRLVLRPVRLEDLPAFHAHARLRPVWDNAGFPAPRSVDETRSYVAAESGRWQGEGEAAQDRFCFSILRRSRNGSRWIGAVNVRWTGMGPGVAEIGYSLHPAAWGKGFMTEAVEKVLEWTFAGLAAYRVQATCWTHNRRSASVLARLGMRREGTLRGYRLHEGMLRDHFLYGMTRDDWNRRRLAALKRARPRPKAARESASGGAAARPRREGSRRARPRRS